MKIYFIGIGGIGVSALARYYLKKGHKATGSDLVSSEITKDLEKLGAKIIIGPHKSENLSKDTDSVIYSPAVKPDNPELLQAKNPASPAGRYKLKTKSYPEALGELTKQYFTIAVSGTHGKSTTTAMLGLLLTKAGLDPTVIVGTKIKEFGSSTRSTNSGLTLSRAEGSNCRVGKSRYLVIEADEHFASFLNYWPKIIVLTNIEADHLDYYKNLDNILKTFREYVGHLPEDGWLVANGDDRNIQKIISNFPIYPPSAEKSSQGRTFPISNFQLESKDAKTLKNILKIPGEHNISNALAVLATARILKIPDKVSFKALSEYRGAWRRFEERTIKLKTKNPVSPAGRYKLISDYGHHPTEVKVTLKAAREKYPKKKILCVFQPHQYQRTYYLFNDFVKVLRQAQDKLFVDKIIITDIYDVAGREEKKIKRKISAEKLVETTKRKSVIYIPKKEILDYLKKNMRSGEVLIVMGAGDIYDLTSSLTNGNL